MKKIIISFLCFIMFLACDVPEYDFNEFYDADPPALVFQPFLKKVVAGSVNRVDLEALEINGTAGMYIKMEYDPDFVAIKEEVAPRYDIPHLKHKTMFHCLPAMAKTSHADDLYGESWTRLKYGEKFIFPGVTMTKDDLYIEFWTTDPNRQVTERSVIYPFAYETWDTDTKRYHRVPYTEYRWWRVTELHEKDGGYVFYAVPSEFQPDFSDPS